MTTMKADDETYSAFVPRRATDGSAGYDFFATEDIILKAGEVTDIDTHIRFEGDEVVYINGYPCREWFMQIVPRSSMGRKYGMRILNTVGVIDRDYPDNIGLRVVTDKDVTIGKGKAYAQGLIIPYGIFSNEVEPTEKRTGGFGSTDAKP